MILLQSRTSKEYHIRYQIISPLINPKFHALETPTLLSAYFSSSSALNIPRETSFSIKGEALTGRPIYLDFQATTPMDPR